MKFLGITMVFATATIIGFFFGEKYLSVLKGIKRAEHLLGNIILGLQSERSTLSEIFENTAFSCDDETKKFLENIKLQNLETVSEIAEECDFCADKTANSILSEAFLVLGKYSAEEQIKEFEFCRNKLRSLYEKNEEAFVTKAKLSRYSGILAGVFFIIILM